MLRALFQFVLLAALLCPVVRSVNAQTTDGLTRRTPESAEQMRQAERRITLDVQVTDALGKPVRGLRQQDLTLLDDGQPRAIVSFREVNGTEARPPTEVMLLVDTMNGSFQDSVIERQGIEAFLRQNGGRLDLPVSIVFLADTGVKLGKPSQDGNSLADDLKKLPTPIRVLGTQQGAEGAQDRSQRSIRAVQSLSTYEETRPGRKLLIWVGPGWSLLSRSTAEVSAKDKRRYFDSIVDVTTALRRAHMTLYSVAPLNLAQVGGQNPLLYRTYLKGVENPSQADSTNLALQVLAVHSGGLVLGQSGDLAGQIALCMADGKNYYEISFDAEDSAAIGYHAVQVKPAGTGSVARTDTAYYAGVPESTPDFTVASASESANTSTSQVVRKEARLVLVDVTVTDKKGAPVKGLTFSDFQLEEDKTAQKIVSVEEHDAAGDGLAAATTTAASSQPSADDTILATNKSPAGAVWNVVLIDLFNTPNEARGRLQGQLEQFLKQLPEHEPVALVRMLSHIKIETSFQDGAGAAYQYLRKNGLGPVDASTPANIISRPGQDVLMPSADPTGSTITNQANVDVDRQANRAQTTLECFSALAQWLAPYPGRKNVYWLSAGFPLEGRPFGIIGFDADTKGGHPIPMQQKTDKELESARIAIYPVDSRGVAAPNADGVTNADSTYEPVGIATALDNNLVAAQRQEMLEIAKATGGTAQFNNNIVQALRDDFDKGNVYYTLAYTPPDKEWKGAYHRIQVSLVGPGDQGGARLVYREGYYARDAEDTPKPTPEQFKEAMGPGAPSAMAVQFTSRITKSGDQATVEYTVEPKTVDLQPDASGQFLTDIDFAIFEYDAKGKVLDKGLIRLSGKMTAEQRAHLTAKTLSAKQTIGLKRGATTLVLGVRDQVSGRFGSVAVALANR